MTVPVSTVWEAPDRVRPVDAPAVSELPDPAAWVAGMDHDTRLDLHGRVVTQALLGEEVLVLEERGGWSRVIIIGQPSSLDPRGYPGWVPSPHLAAWATPSVGRPVVVTALRVLVRGPTEAGRSAPGGSLEMSFGTLLRRDPAGYRAGDGTALEVPAAAVTPPGGAGRAAVAAAETFLGLPYLWGGASAWGVDCSGLAWLCYRCAGRALPRDAHDQAAAGTPVARSEQRPGDLVFFAEPGEPAHHVGIALSPDEMVHAPRTGGTVERAAIDAVHPGKFAGACRYLETPGR